LKDKKYVPEWGGNREVAPSEQIALTYAPLSVEDLFAVQRDTKINVMAGLQFDVEDLDAVDQHWGLIKHVLEKYTKDYENITVDGEPITDAVKLFDVLGPSHMELLAEIFGAVLNASTGSEEDVKNSPSDSGQENPASDTTAEPVSETEDK